MCIEMAANTYTLCLLFLSTLHLEDDGNNITFVPLLEGLESNKAFLGK